MDETLKRFLEILCSCRRVLITTHVRPDGDALGTAAAMALGLRKKDRQPGAAAQQAAG